MNQTGESIHRGYEVSDANGRAILWFAAAFIAAAAVIHLVIGWVHIQLTKHEPHTFAAETPVVPQHADWPQPALQIAPQQDLQELRQKEERLLNSYGWVDHERGIVRIPVDRAIDILSSTTVKPEGKRE